MVLLCLVLSILVVDVIWPTFHRKTDLAYEEKIRNAEFESETVSNERIRCIDENEDALLWRLRMIDRAEQSIVLATFDLRADESGKDVMSAIYMAAERGVHVKILVDGIYKPLYLDKSDTFHALCAHENIEVRFYNPLNFINIYKVNYRMHDKYLIIDDQMYLLGGRNTNDIFLGNYQKGINIDRDILVYETEPGKGESLQQLNAYFKEIWDAPCVKEELSKIKEAVREQEYEMLRKRYEGLHETYTDMESFEHWQEETFEVNKITLISNETGAYRKEPRMLSVIERLAENREEVLIQTPYVICNSRMYQTLEQMEEDADVKIILNAVEKGSNPWGCTDYLNNKAKILEAGCDVYELMNEKAVHTKTVVIDDHLSVVGSYNLDMRSTYLDTELMLVIDSETLNQHIREMDATYMEKSIEIKSDGTETKGDAYIAKELSGKKKLFYGVLRIVIRPFRHLL